VPGGAASAAALRLVTQGQPVRFGVDDRAAQPRGWLVRDDRQEVVVEAPGAADLAPELAGGQFVQRGEPRDVGERGPAPQR